MPHIGYLVQDFPPEVGAGPARVFEMSRRWQELGARVTVITGMPNRRLPGRGDGNVDPRYRGRISMEEDWEGIRTLRSWLFTSERRSTWATILNHLSFTVSSFTNVMARRERFDVIIASSPPFLPQLSGAMLAMLRGTPLVLELRDLWPDYMVELGMLRSRASRQALFGLERWLLNRADEVVVVTESFRTRLIAKGVAAEHLHVVPNGVDLVRYAAQPSRPPVDALVKRAGEPIVGYLGTFGRGQGLSVVVDAAERLRARIPDARFVLAGGGPEVAAITEAARRLPEGAISILPPVPRDATSAFYNACDVCLVPLAPIPVFQETIPSKIFEVMACERPLVASLAGEGARIVAESGGGIATPPGDAAALADAIEHLLVLPQDKRLEMGRRARAYAAAHYDRTTLADRYLELLRRTAAEPPRRARVPLAGGA